MPPVNQKPPKEGRKGELVLEIIEARGLPKADLLGKSDPYVTVNFSTGRTEQFRKTKVISRDLDPQWNESLKFKIYNEEDTATLIVYDYDAGPKADDIICQAPIITFGGSRGNEGDEWIQLIQPAAASLRQRKLKSSWGELHIKWAYTYSSIGDLFAADDESSEEEEDVAMGQLLDSVSRLGAYGYNAAAFAFSAADIMMWSRPFATITTVLFVLFAFFFARTLLDTLFPVLVVVVMGRSYFMRLRFGSEWDQKGSLPVVEMPPFTPSSTVPGARLRRTMPVIRQLLTNPSEVLSPLNAKKYKKLAFVWVNTALTALDAASDILAWRNEAAAQAITRSAILATIFVYYFGIPWGLWKVGFVCAILIGTTVVPCYYMFPRMRSKMSETATEGLASINGLIDPLIAQIMSRIPSWAGGDGGRPSHLPPVPREPRKYDEWKQWHQDREQQREKYGVDTPRTGSHAAYAAGAAPAPAVETSLRVEVLTARKLQPRLANLCPYVKVTLHDGQKFKTKPAPNSSCQWDIAFTFRGLSEEALRRPKLTVELFTTGAGGTPTLLGIGLLFMDSQTGVSDVWLPIREPGGGETCGEVRMCLRTERGAAASRPAAPTTGRPPIVPTPGTVTASSPPTASSPAAKQQPAPLPPPSMGGGGGGGSDVTRQVDALWADSQYEQIHRITEGALAQDPENFELIWRHARACYDLGGEKGKGPEQEKLFRRGLELAMKAKDCPGKDNDKNAYKWCGILQGKMKEYLPTKEGIARVYDVMEWTKKAIAIDPTDDVSQHLMGAVYFNLANLGWAQRKAATMLFGSPPQGTFQDALPFLQESDKLKPTHHNCLMLGDCHEKLGDKASAKRCWQACLDIPAKTAYHRELQAAAGKKV
eukprot:Hpha_TRINITY_DN11128_c0_g1::TRINITY_DN11128_c0_g1_i1::g.27878::m.27878